MDELINYILQLIAVLINISITASYFIGYQMSSANQSSAHIFRSFKQLHLFFKLSSHRGEEGQGLVPVAQPQVHVGGEVVLPRGQRGDSERLPHPVLAEVQVADAVGVTFPDRHGGEQRRAAVPQPQQLVVPQALQQGAEARVVLIVKVVVVTVGVEVEAPEAIGAYARPQLDSPLHERTGAFLKPSPC